jgi:hypothetical protein
MGGRAAIRLEMQTSRICTTSAMSDPGKFVDPTITIPGNPVDSAACISEFARLTQPGCGVPTLDSRVQYILYPGAALVEVSFFGDTIPNGAAIDPTGRCPWAFCFYDISVPVN